MSFQGFHDLSEFEGACARSGFTPRRVPCPTGDNAFVLLVRSPKTATSVDVWHLFSGDKKELASGVIPGGADLDTVRELREYGFRPSAVPLRQENDMAGRDTFRDDDDGQLSFFSF